MTNFTNQKQYEFYCDYLQSLCGRVKSALGISSDPSRGFTNKEFKSNLGERAVLVSDATDGDQYGIQNGQLYPPSLILHINGLLKAEGKDLPIWHSDYESLEYHTRQVCSKDFRFIHQINALPKTAEESEHVTITDPAITGNQTATVETLDENGEWGNKVTLTEGQYQHEKKCQAEDEERHIGSHSPDDSYWDDDDSDPWD